jgi:hypothetical protein
MNGIKIIERGQGGELLRKHCKTIGVPIDMIRALVSAELDQLGKIRKRGLNVRIDEIIGELVESALK